MADPIRYGDLALFGSSAERPILAVGKVALSYTGGVQHAASTSEHSMQNESIPRALCAVVAVVLLWSLVGCHDFFTWFLEVLPVLIGVPLLIHLYPRYRFTNLVYSLIAVHATILMVGGHYTYALMPVFEWIKRNPSTSIATTTTVLAISRKDSCRHSSRAKYCFVGPGWNVEDC